MIPEELKYRVETFRIFGLALQAPGGRLFFDVFYTGINYGIPKLIFLTIFSIGLSILGLILIYRGVELLQ